mgnify:CR=1 FL=1
MLAFVLALKTRIYTYPNSYLLFLQYALGRRFEQNCEDIQQFEQALCDRFQTQYDTVCTYQCRIGFIGRSMAVKTLIQLGQEVILTPYTMIDVINIVIFSGERPVFADVDRETCNISDVGMDRLIHANIGAVLITYLHRLAAEAHRIKDVCNPPNCWTRMNLGIRPSGSV